MENWFYSLLFDYRIFSPQIGRQCDSSLLLQILTLGGEWNSGPWRYVGCGQEPTQLNLFPPDHHPPTGTLPRVLGYPDSSTDRVCVCVCTRACTRASGYPDSSTDRACVCVTCEPSGSGGLLSGSGLWAEASGPGWGLGGDGNAATRGARGRSRWHGVPGILAPRPGSADRLRELRIRGVRGAAHQGHLVLQTGLSHPTVEGKMVFSLGLAVGVWIII